ARSPPATGSAVQQAPHRPMRDADFVVGLPYRLETMRAVEAFGVALCAEPHRALTAIDRRGNEAFEHPAAEPAASPGSQDCHAADPSVGQQAAGGHRLPLDLDDAVNRN